MTPFKRILVPHDGSEPSGRAVAMAVQLAQDGGGRIRLLHVLDQLEYLTFPEHAGAPLLDLLREQASHVLARAGTSCHAAAVPFDTRVAEAPGSRLGEQVAREATEWGADVVVIGTHGRKGMSRALLGSGAEQIIRFAQAPVLVVRDPTARD